MLCSSLGFSTEKPADSPDWMKSHINVLSSDIMLNPNVLLILQPFENSKSNV